MREVETRKTVFGGDDLPRWGGLRKLAGNVVGLASIASLGFLACGGSSANAPRSTNTQSSPACDDATKLRDGGQFLSMPDGARVWYKLAGRDGAPVIAYLHGGPGYNSYAFEKSAGRSLEASFRVLYIDQRGCGRSGFEGSDDAYGMKKTVEDVEIIRAAIGADRLVLIGHSFGGAVAAAYANRFPKSVSAVVMVDTTPSIGKAVSHQVEFVDRIADTAFPDKASDIHAIAASREAPFSKIQKIYAAVGRLPLQRRLHFASEQKQTEMEALDTASNIMGCTSGRAVAGYEREGYLADARPDVATRLPSPALLLTGSSSEVIGKENLESAAKTWGAELRSIDGVGHFVYFEKPREFAQAVTTFLETAASASRAPEWR